MLATKTILSNFYQISEIAKIKFVKNAILLYLWLWILYDSKTITIKKTDTNKKI